jgi:hypothetical protein
MMHLRLMRKPAHPTRALQTATSGLFFAVLSGHKTHETLPSLNTDDPDVLTDGSRNLILGELYLQHRG